MRPPRDMGDVLCPTYCPGGGCLCQTCLDSGQAFAQMCEEFDVEMFMAMPRPRVLISFHFVSCFFK